MTSDEFLAGIIAKAKDIPYGRSIPYDAEDSYFTENFTFNYIGLKFTLMKLTDVSYMIGTHINRNGCDTEFAYYIINDLSVESLSSNIGMLITESVHTA